MNDETQIINYDYLEQVPPKKAAPKPIVDRDRAGILITVYLGIKLLLFFVSHLTPLLFTVSSKGYLVSWAVTGIIGSLAHLLLPFTIRRKSWKIVAFALAGILVVLCLVSDGINIHNMMTYYSNRY